MVEPSEAFSDGQSAGGPSERPEGSVAKRRPRARARGGGAPRAVINADSLHTSTRASMRKPQPPVHQRRSFLKNTVAAFGIGSLAKATHAPRPDPTDALGQNVNTNSKPSDLKITDLRVAVIGGAPVTCPIIRIDTNQGIYGLGEVRDGASKNYALMLKSRLLGQNPCHVDKLFRK